MQRIKKSLTILLAAILSLSVCWFIGQKINPNFEMNKEAELETSQLTESLSEQSVAPEETSNVSVDFQPDLDTIVYEGSTATGDNPWGITAGTIHLEDRGESIFLTPNTTALWDNVGQMEELSFSYELHPWIKESSDGAGLIIWLLDAQDNIIYTEELLLNASDSLKEFYMDLTQYEEVTRIKLLCNNGASGNDSGDWIILSNF